MDLVRAQCMEVIGTTERKKAIMLVLAIRQAMQGQQELDTVRGLEHCGSGWVDIDKLSVIQSNLHANELDGLTALIEGAVLDRQKDCRVGIRRRVVDLATGIVVEA